MLEVRTCRNFARLRPEQFPDLAAARGAEEAIAAVRDGRAGAFPRISEADIAAARDRVSEQFLTSLSIARVNIRRFHEYQKRQGYVHDDSGDGRITRLVRPIGNVGILCGQGFMALLMHALPAQIAGVPRIVVAVAPGENGKADPRVLATAKSLGLDELYLMTGAEAVAALAFGAGSIPRVDKIVGPGGAPAAAAKRVLQGIVGVDGNGDGSPGELVVVADGGANAKFIAADLLAQAEHGAGGPLVLLTNDRLLAEAVRIELGRLAENLPNRAELASALDECGAIYLLPSLDAAIDAANALAPARLSLQTLDDKRYLADIETAGAVFVGPWAAEAAGDYFAGVNSFPPAFGSARFGSGPGVGDFLRETSVVEIGPERLSMAGRHMVALADEERLPARAAAVRERMNLLRMTAEL